MDCEEFRQRLPLLIDGEETADILSHTEDCPLCREEMNKYQQTWDSLALFPEIEPSPDFNARFWQQANKKNIIEILSHIINLRIPAWAFSLVILLFMAISPWTSPPSEKVVYVYITPSPKISEMELLTPWAENVAFNIPDAGNILVEIPSEPSGGEEGIQSLTGEDPQVDKNQMIPLRWNDTPDTLERVNPEDIF